MFCKNCGTELPEGARVCSQCGVPVRASVLTPQRQHVFMGLSEALVSILNEATLSILDDPQMLLGWLMDLVDEGSQEMRVLITNCDEEFVGLYQQAAQKKSIEALDSATERATTILSDNRFIVERVARSVAQEFAEGIGAYLGLAQLSKVSVTATYSVFLCCKEADDATGVRTWDSQLAQRLYALLENAGCSVFYPRATLSAHHPSTHAALVDRALRSASLLVVVGTNKSHLTAEWVQNNVKSFVVTHPGQRNRAVVVYSGMGADQLPSSISAYPRLMLADEQAMGRVSQGVLRMVRENVPRSSSPSSMGASEGVGRSDGLTYRLIELVRDGERTLGLLVTKRSPGVSALLVRYVLPGGSTRRVRIRRLSTFQEAFVLLGQGARVDSIDDLDVTSASSDEPFGLSWSPVRADGSRLALSLKNAQSTPFALNSLLLVLDDPARTLVEISFLGVVPANGEITIQHVLTTEQRQAIRKSYAGDLYLAAPAHLKVPIAQ